MTPLDQDIDGGLGRFRGAVPAAGTALGTAQEPPPEPFSNRYQNQIIPGVVPRLEPTLDLSHQGIRLAEGGQRNASSTHHIRRGPAPVSAQQQGLGRGTLGAVLVISVRGIGPPGALMRSRTEASKCRNKSHLALHHRRRRGKRRAGCDERSKPGADKCKQNRTPSPDLRLMASSS